MSAALAHGFADEALDSQIVFRAIMRALAEPGRVETLPVALEPPAPLGLAAAAAALALCDFETSLWLSPAHSAAARYLQFHTDVRLAPQAAAAFALLHAGELRLGDFNPGTPAYPDRGATLIVECPSLSDGHAVTVAGPGVAGTARFAVAGLPTDFPAQWMANRGRFPQGVDCLFTCGAQLVALPRSTRIVEGR